MIRRRAVSVLAALVAGALAAGCAGAERPAARGAADVRVNGESGWAGTVVRRGYPLPEQEFTDTRGERLVPAADVSAAVTLVFFGYSHCPDICNVVLANLAAALRGAEPEVRDSVQVLFVTTDPARDTPAVVRDYLDRFDPSFEGLVAPVATVEKAARGLHVSYERPDGSTGGYQVQHGAYTTAFVDGRARLVWSESASVAGIRADLARLVRLASTPT